MANTNNCVWIDFETRSKISIENGAFAYAADESADILCVAYAIEDQEPVACTLDQKELLAPLFRCIESGFNIIAHNFTFEIAIIEHVAVPKYDWPRPDVSQYRCTAQMAGRAGLPLSLEKAAIALELDTKKIDAGKSLIKLFSIPQANGQFIPLDSRPQAKAQLLEYCAMDTAVSREIWRNLPSWKDSEIEDIKFDLISNLRGVPVDHKAAKVIYKNVLLEQEQFSERVTKLTNGVITKMTQVQRIKTWLQANVNPDIPDGSADTIQELLDGKWGEVDPISQQILEMRQHSGKSSTGKYVRYINSAVNGYIKGMNISFGAHTGRSVSKLLNLYNLPKPSVKYDCMEELIDDLSLYEAGLATAKYGSYLKAASTAIRGIITAPEGYVLTIADYASIEARIVFWISNCFVGLKKYHDGVDLYVDAATKIYHKTADSINYDERWLGKQCLSRDFEVLTKRGWVSIAEVKNDDIIFDGIEYVTHDGLLDQGIRECIKLEGSWLTKNHEILTVLGWRTAEKLSRHWSIISLQLAKLLAAFQLKVFG